MLRAALLLLSFYSTEAFQITSRSMPSLARHDAHPPGDEGSSTLLNENQSGVSGVTRRTALITGASLSSLAFLHGSTSSASPDATEGQNTSPNALLSSQITMPLIAYSFYKTSPEQAPRGLALALRAGVRHFDMASSYSNLDAIAPLFKAYWKNKAVWKYEEETDELIQKLDETRITGDGKKKRKKGRRQDLFLTYKLSNEEQSTDPQSIRSIVKNLLSQLDTQYIDLVCIHSPLTGSELRLSTYKTLLQLKHEGLIHTVGVCNYGLCHLKQISLNNLPLPSVNQLEISPFNTHAPIVQYCQENGVKVSCAAWSRLSSNDGPVEQWAQLGEIAKEKGVTKAQILVRWALQKGFGCAPRSGTGSKLEVRWIFSCDFCSVSKSILNKLFLVCVENCNS
jgi:diketogulonate reductase-like aldo/keto reductase